MQTTENTSQPQAKLLISGVLSRSWKTLLRSPGVFCGLMLVAAFITFLTDYFLPAESVVTMGDSVLRLIFALLVYVFAMMLQAAVAHAVFTILKGEKASIADSVTRALAHIVPVAIASLLYIAGLFLGLLLLVVPGLMVMCVWEAAIPACIVEKLGPVASLKRSAALTKGYRWQIFGLILITMVPYIGLGILGGALLWKLTRDPLILAAISNLATEVPFAYMSVVMTTIYYDLRMTKEGMTIASLARVFS